MADGPTNGFLDRTLNQLRSAWNDIAGRGDAVRPDLPEDDVARIRAMMVECLAGKGGEVSARARAADLGRSYLTLNPTGRGRFLTLLATAFDVDREAVDGAIADVVEADEERRHKAEARLRAVLVTPRRELLTQFNALPDGTKFLVDMRADLRLMVRDDPALPGLDADLKNLLASWFDIGFLNLEHITWEAPAALLEKLIAYEAVHEIQSWDDLKNRLDSDRRCFAFFHPRMPNEPLIFVEVALVSGMAGNIQNLLDERAPECAPEEADTAIFYSISNAQSGLAGISFGNFLIKRVVNDLAAELPGLKTFATLSPMPGFRLWLDGLIDAGADDLVAAAEAKAMMALTGAETGTAALRALLQTDWETDEVTSDRLQKPLTRLCARYLLVEKRSDRPLDAVARFHLSNGARIERINWLADTSRRGIQQSAGMMINYLYKLDEIEANHEAFSGEGQVMAASAVRALL
jgi:malonyl-CoA decarboxylase